MFATNLPEPIQLVMAFYNGHAGVENLIKEANKDQARADGSIRLQTSATVLGLMLVSLAKIALGAGDSALAMMGHLAEIRATL
ncbi:MAG: hypothetical protein NTY38_29230, partial [Acidobacteria bacterium]|nr:hypothetical protein [Acidobacteriota bacterium]